MTDIPTAAEARVDAIDAAHLAFCEGGEKCLSFGMDDPDVARAIEKAQLSAVIAALRGQPCDGPRVHICRAAGLPFEDWCYRFRALQVAEAELTNDT